MTTNKKFLILLRRGMGLKTKEGKSPMPDVEKGEWALLMQMAKEQSVQGVFERGVRMMPADQLPPRPLLLRSFMLSEKIAKLNRKTDEACVKLSDMIEQAGLPCCILKGQGNALMYTDNTARVPGDIDVWVAAPPRQVIDFARKSLPTAFACYHHVEYVKCDGVEVEIHYRPAYLNNLIHNSRLQRWFLNEAEAQCKNRVELPNGVGAVNVPTDSFNRIFQMAHIMDHVVRDGIGIRQLMDYYFLLRKGFTPEEQKRDEQLLRRFGLYNLAAAVMYTLRQLFAIPVEKMLVPPDSRRGLFLINEVLYGGNFGHYDPLSRKARTPFARNMLRLRRDWRLLTFFPSECLSEPLFRLWHWFWRLRYKA